MGDGLLPWMAAGFSPGTTIAGYRLEEQIGRGGMAVVFRARDERLSRLVALKILSPALAADRGFRHRFVRESQAAAAVDDPNIIPVFEAGDADGVLFIAMRLVRGGDIKSLVAEQGPLPPARAEWIVSAIASALDAAHAHGLVHRDVKPHNILLEVRPGRPDHVYLSDFGLTKASVGSSGLTGSGQFLGTVDYCAPEQIQGQPVDGRADQYALGCTAFELLCGDPPFSRDHGMAALFAHISTEPPKLTSRRSELAPAVDLVFAKVLAKDPADRYATCQEFADALRQALGVQSYAIHPQATRPPAPAAEPAAPENELAAAASADSPAAPEPKRKKRAPRRRGLAAAAAETPAPAHPDLAAAAASALADAPTESAVVAGAVTPEAVAVLTQDQNDAISLAPPPDEAPLAGDLHPSHPSHPSQLGQTTNLRTIRPETVPSPGISEQETEVAGDDPGQPDQTDQAPGPARPGGRRRIALLAGAGLVVVASAATGLILSHGPSAKLPAQAASEAFPQQHYGNGVLAVRHWTLSGHAGSVLTDTVTITNPTATAQVVTYDEPIPGAITPSLTAVRFTPAAKIVDGGRAAQWKLRVPAGGRVVVGYRVTVPADGVSKARLARWASALSALAAHLSAKPAPHHARVVSLTVAPHHVRLTVGATRQLKLTGLLAGHKNATPADLSAVTWKSNDSAVATVNQSRKVSAISAGTSHLPASIGVVSAFAEVIVTSPATPTPGTDFGSGSGSTSSGPGPGPTTTPPTSPATSPNPTPTVTPTTLPAAPAVLVERPASRIASSAGGRAAGDLYGFEVAVSGSVAIVAAPGERPGGAAYIYVRNRTAWHQQARLTVAGGITSFAPFSSIVAVSSSPAGTFALVGDPLKFEESGVVYVFARAGRAWFPQATLTDPAGTIDDDFGNAVAVSGTTAVIAAPGPNPSLGLAYVYVQSGRTWLLQATLADPHLPQGENFGTSVAISGNTVVVGSLNPFNGNGQADVFTRSGTRWSGPHVIPNPSKVKDGAFGLDVAVSGGTVAIGAPLIYKSTGIAYVYGKSGHNWIRRATLGDPGNKPGDVFGVLAISGSRILVGADGGGRKACGTAYEFALARNRWRERAHITDPRCTPSDAFGSSVALSGRAALIGAFGTNKSAGAAYFLTLR